MSISFYSTHEIFSYPVLANIVMKSGHHQLEYCRVIQAVITLHLILRGDPLGECCPASHILASRVRVSLQTYSFITVCPVWTLNTPDAQGRRIQNLDISISVLRKYRASHCQDYVLVTPHSNSAFNLLALLNTIQSADQRCSELETRVIRVVEG